MACVAQSSGACSRRHFEKSRAPWRNARMVTRSSRTRYIIRYSYTNNSRSVDSPISFTTRPRSASVARLAAVSSARVSTRTAPSDDSCAMSAMTSSSARCADSVQITRRVRAATCGAILRQPARAEWSDRLPRLPHHGRRRARRRGGIARHQDCNRPADDPRALGPCLWLS